jgi:transcriptional regulator with XRE-family HTH domain
MFRLTQHLAPMKLVDVRKARGLTLEQLAVELGLKPSSKGFLSRIENGEEACPLRLALGIERWSNGEVLAAEIVTDDDAALLGNALARAAAEAEPAEARP